MGKQSATTPFRTVARLCLALLLVLSCRSFAGQAPNTPLLLPSSVAYDLAGNLYFAETRNQIVRRLSSTGVLSIVAGTGTQGYGGDLGPAIAAMLDSPSALALDGSGDLYIADTHNHRIRRVDAVTGIITTYALAGLPVALAFNSQGLLVYADAATHQVLAVGNGTSPLMLMAGGGIQGFAGDGGPATAAVLDTPTGLAFDSAGNLFLADTHNHRVRRVDAASGIITTVAGTGQPGFSGDETLATRGQLDLPRGLAIDAAGDLLIADSRNQRIRKVDGATDLMTTIAGDGTQAFLGDGSPAVAASLDTPRAITMSPAALPVLADSANNRVREVDSSLNIQTIAGTAAISPARRASVTTLTQPSSSMLTAVVSAAGGSPTGTVTLVDGGAAIASSGLTGATGNFATSILSTGSHTLSAAYSGNASLLPSTSLPVLVTIGGASAADFSLTASAPSSVTVAPGSSAAFSFAIGLTGPALSSPIDLAVSGVPSGATASFSPALIPPPSGPAAFILTIATPASARLRMPMSRGGAAGFGLTILLLPLGFRQGRRGVWLVGLLLLTGCGARVNTGNSDGASPLTYSLTVSATATSPAGATLLHTTQVTLIVD